MDNKIATPDSGVRDSFILFRNSQGAEVRASLLRLTRYLAIFEVYNPYSILQLSEVLSEFKIIISDRMVYSGRAVVSNQVNTGLVVVCEATLDEAWLDVDLFSQLNQRPKLLVEFGQFMKEWQKIYTVLPEYKVVVADMQTFLVDLRRWLEQVELSIRSAPSGDRSQIEREVIQELGQPIIPTVDELFERFERIARVLPQELQPVHQLYIKRQIHPLLLCSPFAYRTYQKPLGYAGDYEMVNMILRDPYEGSSLFAKMMNVWLLNQSSAAAHRNRVLFLAAKLTEETQRMARLGRPARIYNLGCGPAKEVQTFLVQSDLCEQARLTLLDFNDETLQHTGRILDELKLRHRRSTPIQMEKKSVHQILKEAARSGELPPEKKFDFIYCAGLFDYLSDRICKRLMNIFYDLLAPGGLLVATNVDPSNPNRGSMEYVLEWHLVYRNRKQLESLNPDAAPPGSFAVKTDTTGVNVFIEVRKPCEV